MLSDVIPAFQKQAFVVLGVGGLIPAGTLNLRCWCTPEGEFCHVRNASSAVRPNQPTCVAHAAIQQCQGQPWQSKSLPQRAAKVSRHVLHVKIHFAFYRSALHLCRCPRAWPEAGAGQAADGVGLSRPFWKWASPHGTGLVQRDPKDPQM